MKSAGKSAEVKDTFLPGTFCDKMKSAWNGAEIKDTFLLGTFIKKKYEKCLEKCGDKGRFFARDFL